MRGKAALLTGACSEIGRATAARLAELGCDLCLVDAEDAPLDEVAAAAKAAGVRAVPHTADVAQAEACRAAVATAVKAFGRLDALCNVANAFFPAKAAEMAQDEFERTLATNMAAPFYLFQAAIPHLLEANGAMVSVSSAAGAICAANTVAYSASKAGLNHMTRVLAKEYMDAPVRINVVAPGAVVVDLTPKTERPTGVDPNSVRRGSAARGTISVHEVAEVIAFLASDAAQAYHGAVIEMDKGMHLG
jgi:NAD(P)-dependent dehydrogenase (short-subunit alcohol dehydrogenase family)